MSARRHDPTCYSLDRDLVECLDCGTKHRQVCPVTGPARCDCGAERSGSGNPMGRGAREIEEGQR